jgi:alanyl-tRNA synthetase
VAFKLHDTYGFPLDLSADVCRERKLERGLSKKASKPPWNAQKSQQARAAGKFKMDKALEYTGAGNTFVGYEQLTANCQGASCLCRWNKRGGHQSMAKTVWSCWTPRPFYAESGGQVGDQGVITRRQRQLRGG